MNPDPILLTTGFAASPQPFCDFLVVQVVEGTTRPGLRESTADLATRLGLAFTEPEKHILAMCTMPVHSPSVVLSGVATTAHGVLVGPSLVPCARHADLSGSTGQFTSLRIDEDGVRAEHDYFAMGALYTFEWPDGALVTNRAHLAAAFLYHNDIPTRPNIPRTTAVVLDHMFFSAQSFTDDTPITGLSRLPADSGVTITAGKLRISRVASFHGSDATIEDYERHLSAARDEVVNNVHSVHAAFPGRAVIHDVSGGKDSRLALAPAVASGSSAPITVNTVDTANSADLNISAQICATFDLSYRVDDATELDFVEHSEMLALWRSFQMGEYNAIGAALGRVSRRGTSGTVRVTGAAGEIHRDFWNAVFAPMIDRLAITRLEDLVSTLLRDDSSPYAKKLPEALQDRLRGYVHAQFADYNTLPLEDALHRHYLHYRNRTHFGMRLFSTYNDTLSWMPLLSKSLFSASQCVSSEERRKGKPFIDLVRMICPALADIPYDGEPRGAETTRAVDHKLEEWRQSQDATSRARYAAMHDHATVHSAHLQQKRIVEVEVAHSLARLGRVAPELTALASVLQASFADKMRRWPKQGYQLASKVLSLDDFFFPLRDDKVESMSPGAHLQFLSPLAGVIARRLDGEIACEVTLYDDIEPSEYEFAFYLYDDDVRVDTAWYSSATAASFPDPNGDVRVTAFARHRDGSCTFSEEGAP